MTVPFFRGQLAIPTEVVEDIAFALLASTPLNGLGAVLPLLQTSRGFLNALSPASATTLYSRLCRLKFDISAAERRGLSLNTKDLTCYLLQMHNSLSCIWRGDVFDDDASRSLLDAFVMMLHDDGKNRAQLEEAGIVPFVDQFIRLRLHALKDRNDMWPLENAPNSAVLWLSWLFTTKEQLENETEKQRNDLITLVLPFLLCPYRYASAYAPSNYFILPLRFDRPSFQTAHGPYPVHHTKQQSPAAIHLFHTRTNALIPPISAAAKLLFWSRRETQPFFNTSVCIPQNRAELGGRAGLTIQDLVEFNSVKVAKFRPVVRWDWDQGTRVAFHEDGTRKPWPQEPSKRWDIDWWRIRMCQNVLSKQPRWRLGNVYERGLLTGLWQGVYFLPDTESLTEVLRTKMCPDAVVGLSDLLPRPIFMRLREHNFVRTPDLCHTTDDDPTSQALHSNPIPAAPEVSGVEDVILPVDVSIGNAWIPGPIGGLGWYEGDGINPSIERDLFTLDTHRDEREPMRSMKFTIPPGLPSVVRDGQTLQLVPSLEDPTSSDLSKGFVYETYEAGKESVHERMTRAKEQSKYCACTSTLGHIGLHPHPGCIKCADREEFLKAKRGDVRSRHHHLTNDHVDDVFATIGMGRQKIFSANDEEGVDDCAEEERRVVDLEFDRKHMFASPSHRCGGNFPEAIHVPRRGTNSVYSGCSIGEDLAAIRSCTHSGSQNDLLVTEVCDDGIEDTVVTGEPDECHSLAWGSSVYYGRVRPWDGMVAILKQHQRNGSWSYGNFLFYGYVYGGDTFVGNWRFASVDPITPGFESPFIMSKRGE